MGCLRRLLVLVLVVALAAFAWLERDALGSLLDRIRGADSAEVAPSAAIAATADAKLQQLAEGLSQRVALSSVEAQSLIRFRYAELLPGFLDSPAVAFDDGHIRLGGRIPVDRLPRVAELDEIVALMPDTTDFEITTQLIPLDSGRVALAVDGMEAHGIPLPRRLAPALLRRLGRADEPGLPPDAFAFRLPPGVGGAYVRGDSLVLLSRAEASH